MPYTVKDAITAVANRQATLAANYVAYVEASVLITDAGAEKIWGRGPLSRTGMGLGNLWSIWDSPVKIVMRRGTGPSFLLGLNIEPIVTFVGPLVLRPADLCRIRSGALFRLQEDVIRRRVRALYAA